MEQINHSGIYTLRQLTDLLEQLTPAEYALPLNVLNQNTIGKHVRHIIEIYQALFRGLANSSVDYDNRARDLQLETSPADADRAIETLIVSIKNTNIDFKFTLVANQSYQEDCHLLIESNLIREMLYCLEHAIHHMAIIAIAIRTSMPHIQLHPHFGVAYSTVRHLEQTLDVCVQ